MLNAQYVYSKQKYRPHKILFFLVTVIFFLAFRSLCVTSKETVFTRSTTRIAAEGTVTTFEVIQSSHKGVTSHFFETVTCQKQNREQKKKKTAMDVYFYSPVFL